MNGGQRLSGAVRVMIAPESVYRDAASSGDEGSWLRTIKIPALIAVLLGIITAVAATHRVIASLVLSQTVCWSFVPALQFLTGALLVGSVRDRRMPAARALELLFAAHGPWSFWLVGLAGALTLTTNPFPAIATAIVPAAWTSIILFAFCREVLGLTTPQARLRTLGHQALTWLLTLIYVEVVSQLVVRVFDRGLP